ncbi:hypothetical protein SULAZ_1003 [Sulfurihydrogenibium azorense Az-Fu1]|uniref:Uncharacterized protein n=1 Tax=Sulfurihydrogenibium azorense (strain DSM 15241 / OCM 825 / Az-Fu1) TaxID=204536 RepID=C1DV39_SULAA|nr:hypothetical protein [Sulfurihydrogenibium azorense]ACN98845.1 hypothetical protein SULAZ_1003 [Sulfurihydrogenibium azorense Az-Fu1]MDM7273171.1 hypothetical protein [Sulfurihydrogenibium azorense]
MSKRVIFFILIVALLSLTLRSLYTQNKFISLAKNQAGLEKIKSLEKAILFYVPFSPFNEIAINELKKECQSFSKNDEKLYCYETIRSSLLQIKNVYQPYKETLDEIIPIIASLRAKEMINWEFNNYKEEDFNKLYESQLKLLKYDNTPSTFWSFIVGFSLIGWISSIIFLIWKGLGENIDAVNIFSSLIAFLAFFSLWILGLYMA